LGGEDRRELLVSRISLDKAHVILTPPIVFLFGGCVQGQNSIRGKLYHHLMVKNPSLFKNLVVPEHFKDWLHDSNYPDLLTFESDLAQTSTLVVIALESAGSIAELGSFSVSKQLSPKVVAVLSEYHHSKDSFIKLGPLRQLAEGNVYSYPYDHEDSGSLELGYLEDFAGKLDEHLQSSKSSEAFDAGNNGHIALLIFEFVLMLKALKLSEIEKYLEICGFEKSQSEIKRSLFLLTKLDFVVVRRMGNIDFYLPNRKETRIKFGTKKGPLFDRAALTVAAAESYRAPSEKMRLSVIKNHEIPS
jgi:hypothetical protein